MNVEPPQQFFNHGAFFIYELSQNIKILRESFIHAQA